MNTLYVGIDVSSKSNVAYFMKPDGSKHSILTVDNNRLGAQKIVDRITSVLQTLDKPEVVIGMEATSVYGDNLMYFLRESGSLAKFNRRLHMLNPKQVKKFKDAYSDLPKNDPTDAFVIADNLRFGRIDFADFRRNSEQNSLDIFGYFLILATRVHYRFRGLKIGDFQRICK